MAFGRLRLEVYERPIDEGGPLRGFGTTEGRRMTVARFWENRGTKDDRFALGKPRDER